MEVLVQYCRICARNNDELKFPISTVSQISQETIEDMLIYCTQLEVTPYDGLPQQVCAGCMNSLNAAFFFRKLCYKSDATLKELRRGTTVEAAQQQPVPSRPPPAPELVVLLEKIPLAATGELILKNENIDQEEELYEPEMDFDDPYMDEDYTPGESIELTSSIKDSERVPKGTLVCRSVNYCTFVTTNHHKMEEHMQKTGHPTFETEGNLNGPDDPLVGSSEKRYVCKYQSLCEYRTAHKSNFERHQKNFNHFICIKIGEDTSKRPKKLFKCKECSFQHNKQNEFSKHQLQTKHRVYTVQDPKSFVCPNCNIERKCYKFLIKHMVSCTGIEDLEEIKRLADESLASQSAKETVKTEVELFDLVPSIEGSEDISANLDDNAAEESDHSKRSRKTMTANLYVCRHKNYCDFVIDNLTSLDEHKEFAKHPLYAKEGQTNSNIFTCKGYTFCKYQTTFKFNFMRHQAGANHTDFTLLENQTSQKVYKCQECEFQHNKRCTFKQHQSEHNHRLCTATIELFFACPNCDFQCSKYSNLSEHMGSCTDKINPGATGYESDVSDPTTTSRRKLTASAPPSVTSNASRESSPGPDSLAISESNRDKNSWVVRCDFCSYACNRDKVSNIQRHIANKCKPWQYQDESQDIFSHNTPRNVYTTSAEIAALTSLLGKKLLPQQYEPELFSSTTANYPPVKLVTSVLRYGWWLVLTIRGVRCCGCSMFFEDENSLKKHRSREHPTARLSHSEKRPHCEQCFRVFPSSESFNYHLQLQASAKLIYCITCAKLLISNTAWIAHCGLFHVSAPHFDVQADQSSHRSEISAEKRNSIEIKEELTDPISSKMTKGEKKSRLLERYRCPRCTFRCAKLASLRTHIVKHGAVIKFACRICNVSYGTQLDLQQHKRRTHDFKQGL